MMWNRRGFLTVLAGVVAVAGLGVAGLGVAGLGVAGLGTAQAQGLVSFPSSQAEIVTAAGKRHRFTLELATSPEQLTQGLMFRRTLAADAGMLFDFGMDRPVSMWMRNTLIPLDMLFLTADGHIAGYHERAVPGSQDIISAPGLVRAVLELNGGTISRLGLAAGDRVVHPMFGGR